MAISRMQEPQQIRSGLGSLQDPRQNYGFGSFVKKAVKKATRGVKKIAKSPLGKAALIGGIGMYGMGAGPFSGMKGSGFLKGMMGARNMASGPWNMRGVTPGGGGFWNMIKGGANKLLNPWQSGSFSGKHAFGLGAAALAATPFLMGKDEPEEEVEEAWTSVPSSIADIRNQARAHYTNPGASTLSFMPAKEYVQSNFYAADGGRAGLMNGGEPGQEQIEQMLMAEYAKYKNKGGTLTFEQFVQAIMQQQQEQQGGGMEQPQEVMMAAQGGRIGYQDAGPVVDEETMTMIVDMNNKGMDISTISSITETPLEVVTSILSSLTQQAYGGRIGKQEGGIMETEVAEEMIDLGGKEKDYRETGGFVELGGKERADDVPARLSKNEFVFTADAVRNAGGGDIDKGSEVMQNLMDNLEAGGEVSEDSQGLEGAQAMYDQQQMLQSRIA